MKFLPRAVALIVAAFVIVGIGIIPDNVRSLFQRDLYARTNPPVSIGNSPSAVLSSIPSRIPTEPVSRNVSISGVDVSIAPSYNPRDDVQVLPPLPSAIEPTATPVALPVVRLPPTPTPAQLPAFNSYELYFHLPPDAAKRGPLPVVVALHGMGGKGEDFARPLIQASDQNGWILIAPTIPYRDYMNPKTLWEDDFQYTQMLHTTLGTLADRLGVQVQPRVTILGFSRGAQLAHRFAFFFPDQVQTVVAISAGAYTLPIVRSGSNETGPELKLPYGIADFENTFHYPLDFVNIRKLSFFIAVGADDNKPGEVPREFDPYVGKDRVERAKMFSDILKRLGVETKLAVFPNTGHEVTADMRRDTIVFIRDHIPSKQ